MDLATFDQEGAEEAKVAVVVVDMVVEATGVEGEEVKVAAAMVVATAKAKGTAEVETTALPTGA